AAHLMSELLVDPLAETSRLMRLDDPEQKRNGLAPSMTVLLKPGVMDPVAMSVHDAARGLGLPLETVRTFRRYYLADGVKHPALRRVLANDAIEQIVEGAIEPDHLSHGVPYRFQLVTVPLREMTDAALEKLSRDGQLALNLAEMRAIQTYFRE